MNKYCSLFIILIFLPLSGICAKTKENLAKRDDLSLATFAGGCFWCVEADFEKVSGVIEVISGFSGGSVENPSYKQVSAGTTGHLESIQVYFDPTVITYKKLLQAFWRQIDPTDAGGQFVDRGEPYRTAIFYHDDAQRQTAERSKQQLQASGRYPKAIVTSILPLKNFYEAEAYHQNYYRINPIRYKYYRYRSGRDQYLTKTWGEDLTMPIKIVQPYVKPSDTDLRSQLTSLQYQVTQKEATERPFDNSFWNETRSGIYVDIVSGEPLFSSTDKYKSGTGWPSFTRPLKPEHIIEKVDAGLFTTRTEVRSKYGDSHLGHVFTDGPQPTGLRYCINSAALRFIPAEELESSQYKEYKKLFQDK